MARIICDSLQEHLNSTVYKFVRGKLPEYIAAYFHDSSDRADDNGFLLFVPHTGVFVFEENKAATYEDFRQQCDAAVQRVNNQIESVRNLLKEKFNLSPIIYGMVCFSNLTATDVNSSDFSRDYHRDYVFKDDLVSAGRFLGKLTLHRLNASDVNGDSDSGRGSTYKYEDLRDKDVHDLYYCWDNGLIDASRPDHPPLVFLSYNRNNNEISRETQAVLEQQNIFVWRAPKDIPLQADYREEEVKAIRNCDLFLVLLSHPAQRSEEVKFEIDKAIEFKKRLFPVWVEDLSDAEVDIYIKETFKNTTYRLMTRIDKTIIEEIVREVR